MDRNKDNLKGSEYIAHLFKEYGVSHIFYQEVCLRFSVREAEKLGIKAILAHSEHGAAYMADGYARISGRPGICGAQSIGAANLASGVADAWLATTPVIAITGKKPPTHQYKNAYQEVNHEKLFEGVVKFQADAVDPQQMPYLLRQCFRESVSGKPRPVHLDILGITGEMGELDSIKEPFYSEPLYGKYPPFRPMAEESGIEEAIKSINNAERPVIVAGRGATVSGAGEAIKRFSQKADIPVTTTPDGKTLVDEDGRLWAGVVGGYGMMCALNTLKNADLVIFIGTQTSDQTTCDWCIPTQKTKVIQIDIDPAELGRNYPNSIALLGDAKTITYQLEKAVAARKNPKWTAEITGYVEDTMKEQEKRIKIENKLIKTESLCHELSKVLPDNVVLVADTGYSAAWTSSMVRMKASQDYVRAAGTLGWAFPASLGVKCGAGDRPVICFTGDGGLYYHLMEMETAVRNGINTVTVLNNNRVLLQDVPSIEWVYKGEEEKGISKITFPEVNFTKIAKEFGMFAIQVNKTEDIGPAINKALKSNRPALVEVITDGDGKSQGPCPGGPAVIKE